MKLTGMNLLYNAAAHFAALDKYPDGVFEVIKQNDGRSFEALCWLLAEEARQAELMRRYMGEDAKPYPTQEEIMVALKPGQVAKAGKLALDAYIEGLKSGDDDDEVDEILLEFEKKTSDT